MDLLHAQCLDAVICGRRLALAVACSGRTQAREAVSLSIQEVLVRHDNCLSSATIHFHRLIFEGLPYPQSLYIALRTFRRLLTPFYLNLTSRLAEPSHRADSKVRSACFATSYVDLPSAC